MVHLQPITIRNDLMALFGTLDIVLYVKCTNIHVNIVNK